MLDGENDLEIVGRLGVMVSESAAVHVPDVQPAPVLVTPEGTEMNAVLVTCVCANAGSCRLMRKKNSHKPHTSTPVDLNPNHEFFRRVCTFCLLSSKETTCYS
jgi:hypothetical protein